MHYDFAHSAFKPCWGSLICLHVRKKKNINLFFNAHVYWVICYFDQRLALCFQFVSNFPIWHMQRINSLCYTLHHYRSLYFQSRLFSVLITFQSSQQPASTVCPGVFCCVLFYVAIRRWHSYLIGHYISHCIVPTSIILHASPYNSKYK